MIAVYSKIYGKTVYARNESDARAINEFDESKHPRQDDGKFGASGGGGKSLKQVSTSKELWSSLGKKWNTIQNPDDGISMAKVRKAFPEIKGPDLDKMLLQLQADKKIVIYPHDDGSLITKEVKENALRFRGRDLHIIYKR